MFRRMGVDKTEEIPDDTRRALEHMYVGDLGTQPMKSLSCMSAWAVASLSEVYFHVNQFPCQHSSSADAITRVNSTRRSLFMHTGLPGSPTFYRVETELRVREVE